MTEPKEIKRLRSVMISKSDDATSTNGLVFILEKEPNTVQHYFRMLQKYS
jgi:hypothetical protein